VLAITLCLVVVQAVGGLLSGSLALLADAGHMLTDATGVVIALIAGTLAARPATNARTLGLQRAEILAALGNAVLLAAVAVWVLAEAAGRWRDPPDVSTGLMIAVASAGALANGVCLLLLRGGQRESLNLRGAYLEVLGDLLGSVAVVVAGVVIALTGYTRRRPGIGPDRGDDPAQGMVPAAGRPRRCAAPAGVLLEATPRGVDLDQVRDHVRGVPGVVDVRDLHAWTITSGVPVLSAHIVVDQECVSSGRTGEVLDRLGQCLAGQFDVEHCTFQVEPVGHREQEAVHHR